MTSANTEETKQFKRTRTVTKRESIKMAIKVKMMEATKTRKQGCGSFFSPRCKTLRIKIFR